MSNFRAVILDYPKLMIESGDVKKVLGDMIQSKQINFSATSENYVPLSGLDMVSTHFLVYEVSDIFNPKIVMAIRTCYEDRVYKHNLSLPIDQYSKWLDQEEQNEFNSFRSNKGPLADVNAWFVDPEFTYKKTGLNLSEFGFFMVVTHILKRGFNNLVGTTNEKYKASRWVEPIGHFKKGVLYKHKFVPDPHLFVLISEFKYDWYFKKIQEFDALYSNRIEYRPNDALHADVFRDDKAIFQEAASLYHGSGKVAATVTDIVSGNKVAS